jgi:CRISPR/Cas system endoribonuclease Cas6 (RAMP superfamily)
VGPEFIIASRTTTIVIGMAVSIYQDKNCTTKKANLYREDVHKIRHLHDRDCFFAILFPLICYVRDKEPAEQFS